MKKRTLKSKICSLSIALCMAINTFTFVEATELSNIFKATAPENELENVSLASDETEAVLSTEEIESLIESDTDYSELSEAEKEQISDEYLVNETVMEECETAGYSLSESVELAKIFQNTDLTPEQFEEMADNFGDRDVTLQQAKKFANYRYTHSSFNMGSDTVCIGYLVSGIYAGDILKARAMAAFLEMDIAEIADFEYTDDGSDDISYIADMFNTRKDVLEAYISNTEMSNDDFVAKVSNELGGILKETGDAPATYATSVEYEYNPQYYPLAPFTYDNNGSEIINEQTGAVRYENIGAVIPGKNGLDLTIGVRYDSDDSSNREITTQAIGIGTITKSNLTIPRKMYSPLCMFSNGWNFKSSYIRYYVNGFDDIYSSVVDSEGISRKMRRRDVENEDKEEVSLYNANIDLQDVRLYKDSSYTDNEITSLFCAKYKDGKKEYFDAQGRLMKVENRFGDAILYRYYTTGTEIDYHKQIYNKVEITDTLGQITTIEKGEQVTEYDADGNEIHIQPMIATLPDQKTITYRIRGSQHYRHAKNYDYAQVLDSITNQEGMTTSFEYKEDDVSAFNYFDPSYYDAREQAFYPMTAVVHPTGIRTEYTYEQCNGTMVIYLNTFKYYRILERKETDGTNDYNKVTYTYEKDYTSNKYDTFKASSTNSDGLITEKTFQKYESGSSRYRLKTGERTYYMDVETEVNVTKTDYDDYYERTYPQTVTKYVYNQDGTQYLSTTEKYEYDEFGDCIKYWDARANGDTTNTENLTTYAYDSEYHYLTESSYVLRNYD